MQQASTAQPVVLVISEQETLPDWLRTWWEESALMPAMITASDDEHIADVAFSSVMRARPRAIVIDFRGTRLWRSSANALCRALKRNPFTGIVPVCAIVESQAGGRPRDPQQLAPTRQSGAVVEEAVGATVHAFDAGADEVLRDDLLAAEALARLDMALRRSDRDTDVHPSTRLSGAREIGAELQRRVNARDYFAACYADLDHFKEFNDRYGYHHGDAVIRLLARILHDVVSGLCASDAFVGHIGGDDFLFVVPLTMMSRVCDEIIRTFEELIGLQYSEQDRRVGYFFGKDRRGQLYRVPLMTLSIGVVTNQRRHFVQGEEVSELVTEMKSYAKTLPGSIWVVDRRREDQLPANESGASATYGAVAELRDRVPIRRGGTGR